MNGVHIESHCNVDNKA